MGSVDFRLRIISQFPRVGDSKLKEFLRFPSPEMARNGPTKLPAAGCQASTWLNRPVTSLLGGGASKNDRGNGKMFPHGRDGVFEGAEVGQGQ